MNIQKYEEKIKEIKEELKTYQSYDAVMVVYYNTETDEIFATEKISNDDFAPINPNIRFLGTFGKHKQGYVSQIILTNIKSILNDKPEDFITIRDVMYMRA